MQALALWPICWWSESNDAVLLWAIKQGGGNCRVKVTPQWRVALYYSNVHNPHFDFGALPPPTLLSLTG